MILGIFKTLIWLRLVKFFCRLKTITIKMNIKKSVIFPLNGCCVSKFRSQLSLAIQKLQIHKYEWRQSDSSKLDISTNEFPNERLAISDDFCNSTFSANKLIFTDGFHINESTINNDLPVTRKIFLLIFTLTMIKQHNH